tara:strand:- start:149 stop:730 length:582 start_codon:yes stop_codon:yes gene_type:complete
MSIQQKKIKRLRKEIEFLQSELDYVYEVLEEWHLIFEDYHRNYCKDRKIDLGELNRQCSKKVDQLISEPSKKDTGLIIYKDKKDKDVFKKIYKQIAKKLHPDAGGDEEQFKKATSAMQEKNLQKLLDICDEHAILIEVDENTIDCLKKQILDLKNEIDKQKSTYSWSLYSCASDKCKDRVIKKFLKHLFNYEE